MGHANFAILESMTKRDLVRGMPHIKHPTQVCVGCLVAKQTRKSLSQEANWRATEPLELVHADLYGPILPQTIRGKDEAFDFFKRFKVQVEQENSYKVKMLRTNRGGEFTSRQFDDYCQKEGIKRQLTAPCIPQQNGVVERRNRTVVEMTRSLLKTMQVPDQFWGEAVSSVYAQSNSDESCNELHTL